MILADLAEFSSEQITDFLLTRREAMFYHSPKYQDFLVELLGCQKLGAVVVEGANISGVVTAMETSGSYGRIINSLPFFGSHGGLIFDNEASGKMLGYWLNSRFSENDVAAATIIENPFEPSSSVGRVEADLMDERIGQFTPLSAEKSDPEVLLSSLHPKTRNMVRKAIGLGVTVRRDPSQLQTLAELHTENMEVISAIPKPKRFFDLIPSHFEIDQDWQCWSATIDNEVVAALLVFHFNQITEYFTPVIRADFRSSQALSLIIFEAMRDASRRGMRWWNWGGTWKSQESVYRFKSRWGTVDMPYRYHTKVNSQRILSQVPQILLAEYPFFYVLPFGKTNVP